MNKAYNNSNSSSTSQYFSLKKNPSKILGSPEKNLGTPEPRPNFSDLSNQSTLKESLLKKVSTKTMSLVKTAELTCIPTLRKKIVLKLKCIMIVCSYVLNWKPLYDKVVLLL